MIPKLQSLMVLLAFYMVSESAASEEIHAILPLNENGTLKNPDKTPVCNQGTINIIQANLLKYEYHYSYGKNETNKEPLSDVHEYYLHKSCSWQKKCLPDLQFPYRNIEQKQTTNSVAITYTCLDIADSVINMCTTDIIPFREVLYLSVNESITRYQACECHINNGLHSIEINDMRLTNKIDAATCTSLKLMVNSNHEFLCSPEKNNFGSSFHNKVIESEERSFIAIKKTSARIDTPAMVMLIIRPKENAEIECSGKEPSVIYTSLVAPSSTTYLQTTLAPPSFIISVPIWFLVVALVLVFVSCVIQIMRLGSSVRMNNKTWKMLHAPPAGSHQGQSRKSKYDKVENIEDLSCNNEAQPLSSNDPRELSTIERTAVDENDRHENAENVQVLSEL